MSATMMWGQWDGGSWGFVMMILVMLFLALIVVGAVLVARSFAEGRSSGGQETNGAMDILNERFARGEIDKDEFAERRRVLAGRG